MKRSQRLLTAPLAFGLFILIATVSGRIRAQDAADTQSLTAPTGYRFSVDIYPATGPLALVFLHGKNSVNRTPNTRGLAARLAAAGITVYLPVMPWSRAWNGTVADGHGALDTLVERAAATGKKVMVVGQSLGAAFAMTYRPADPPAAVIGKVFMNPGGLLDLIPPASPFWRTVGPEVERAKALEAAGQGQAPVAFGGANAIGESLVSENYTMAPLVYLSFHDPSRFPSIRASLQATRLPVFWSSGTRDPTLNAKRRTFELVLRNAASVYLEPDGDHNSAMLTAIEPLIGWLAARART